MTAFLNSRCLGILRLEGVLLPDMNQDVNLKFFMDDKGRFQYVNEADTSGTASA